eukprot:COSAG03_NODE_4843_length_1414_cov_1.055513_4_plen_47_part_01
MMHSALLIVTTAICPSPLKHLQMTSPCCLAARPCVPVAAISPSPLKH